MSCIQNEMKAKILQTECEADLRIASCSKLAQIQLNIGNLDSLDYVAAAIL